MCGSPKVDTSATDFAKKQAEDARATEVARQARIATGMANIKGVFEGDANNPGVQPLLDQRRTAQENYYNPQLDQQFTQAKKDTTYALARAGLLNSTAAGEKQANLGDMFALKGGEIASNINSDIANTSTNMQQTRASLEAALRSSADSTAATDAALASAATFRQNSPTLSPLGSIFAGLSQGIGSAQNGYQVGLVQRAATPAPLNRSYARSVG